MKRAVQLGDDQLGFLPPAGVERLAQLWSIGPLGFLVADAERRTSAAGKSGVRLRISVGRAEATQWARVVVFGEPVDAASALKDLRGRASDTR